MTGISIEQARNYYENDSAHDFDHVLRVWANAQKIAAAEAGVDLAVLRTAVLLHDIARADQQRTGKDHAVEGARRAREILADEPPAFVQAVSDAIASHRFRVEKPPQSIEAKILYDADKLDSIGAVGVARAFAYSGYRGERLWAEDDEGIHTAFQEFKVKLSKLKNKLLTPSAQKIAEQRHQFMIAFFEQMAAEVRGER